ncbi:MAG TPA: cyclodeaminase/cyclohydrolase family protein [Tepidisphaeraceae bacterium]
MPDHTAPIDSFLNAAAARVPAPGGGAVTALAGALAASMGEMVLNYSIGKKDLVSFDGVNTDSLHQLTRARALLLELLSEDQAAFAAYTDAKKAKQDLHQLALACVRVPQLIGTAAEAILKLAVEVAPRSNRWLLSDLAVCGELAMATVRCAIHNVNANLGDLTPDEVKQAQSENAHLLATSLAHVQKLMTAITDRQAA